MQEPYRLAYSCRVKEGISLYSDVSRDEAYKARLLGFVEKTYGLEPVGVAPAKRGFFGETWRLDTSKASCFLKLDYSPHQGIYERSFPIIAHLCDNGIDYISRIVKTAQGELRARFDGAVLGVFEWIDGENIETDDTKPPEYRMLARVYTVPAEGLAIPREDFSAGISDKFDRQWERLKRGPANEAAAQALAFFEQDREKLAHRAERLRLFAARCRGDTSRFVITHGDAGGNVIVNGGRYAIVDWDYAMLAPPERDAWVMCCRDRSWAWAKEAFHNALRGHGIDYALRPERLAYYAYHFFFYYLTEILDALMQTGNVRKMEEYCAGWVDECFRYADTITP